MSAVIDGFRRVMLGDRIVETWREGGSLMMWRAWEDHDTEEFDPRRSLWASGRVSYDGHGVMCGGDGGNIANYSFGEVASLCAYLQHAFLELGFDEDWEPIDLSSLCVRAEPEDISNLPATHCHEGLRLRDCDYSIRAICAPPLPTQETQR